tara:strand:- start:13661 stop:13945 length:285 start_codon:yes stop_codon:yes gene_type:complete
MDNCIKRIEYKPNEIVLTTADEAARMLYEEIMYYGDNAEENTINEQNAALEAGIAWAAAIEDMKDCEMTDMMNSVNINNDPTCDNSNNCDHVMG